MIAINDAATTIHRKHAIGIAIKREPHRGSALDHSATQRLEMGGPAAHIDAFTISITVQHREVSTESAEHLGTASRRGSPTEIKNDRHTGQTLMLNAAQQAVAIVIQKLGAMAGSTTGTQRRSLLNVASQAGFNPVLQGRAELAPVRAEHLDAVVLRGVMAG